MAHTQQDVIGSRSNSNANHPIREQYLPKPTHIKKNYWRLGSDYYKIKIKC